MKTGNTILLSIVALAMFSLSSCGKFTPESLVSSPWHCIMSLKNSGETKVTLTPKTSDLDQFASVIVMKTGSEKTAVADARLRIMTDEEVSLISPDYRAISPTLCTFEEEIHFSAEETGKKLSVGIDGSGILDQLRADEGHTYVLPLILESDKDSVNVNLNSMIYVFSDGEVARKLDGSVFELVYATVPDNTWGSFSTANLFDGNDDSYYRTVPFSAKSIICKASGYNDGAPLPEYDSQALWCNREDHTESDYTFIEFWNNGDLVYQPVSLPWVLIFDMKQDYRLSKIRTVVSKMIEGGVDMSSYYQRIKDIEYSVSMETPDPANYLNDEGWTKIGEHQFPVYDGRENLMNVPSSVKAEGRYLRLIVKSLHWREKTVEEIAAKYDGKTYDQVHGPDFLRNNKSVSKDADYAEFKKCASVDLGPVIIGEIEIMARNVE